MPEGDLQALVRRRLWELARSPEEATRSTRWALAAETVQRLARDRGRAFISEGLVPLLATSLDVPENRIRRAAGLPLVADPRESVTTRPHLRVIRADELPPRPPLPRESPADPEPSRTSPTE